MELTLTLPVIASIAKQSHSCEVQNVVLVTKGLPRRVAPRNDIKFIKICLFFLWVSSFITSAYGGELSGYVALEERYFAEEGLHEDQEQSDTSVAIELEYFQDWSNGAQGFLFVPFARFDSVDEERSNVDIRELYWFYVGETWELYLGLRKIFWGVTESQHLVDIINQTDLVENPDGEEKLGQPMIHASFVRDWGILDLFVLTGFRERTFPGESGRFRLPLEIDINNATYEAKEEASRIDFATRWSHSFDDIDLGLSFFSGTNRSPELRTETIDTTTTLSSEASEDQDFSLNVTLPSFQTPKLIPHYNVIQQLGLDAQWVLEDWLLKLEAITQQHHDIRYSAYTLGFEYTFANVQLSGLDIGWITEYLYDDRGDQASTPFEQDAFAGLRFAFNDVQSTELLFGGIVDMENGSKLWRLESSRRFGESTKVTLEGNWFADIAEDDILYAQRKDSALKLEIAQFF